MTNYTLVFLFIVYFLRNLTCQNYLWLSKQGKLKFPRQWNFQQFVFTVHEEEHSALQHLPNRFYCDWQELTVLEEVQKVVGVHLNHKATVPSEVIAFASNAYRPNLLWRVNGPVLNRNCCASKIILIHSKFKVLQLHSSMSIVLISKFLFKVPPILKNDSRFYLTENINTPTTNRWKYTTFSLQWEY